MSAKREIILARIHSIEPSLTQKAHEYLQTRTLAS